MRSGLTEGRWVLRVEPNAGRIEVKKISEPRLSLPQTYRFCKRTAASGLPFGGFLGEVVRLLVEAKINLKVDPIP